MARRAKFKRSKKMTLPLAVVAGFVPPALGVWNRRNSVTEMGNFLVAGFSGLNPGTGEFNIGNLRYGVLPIVAGFMVHMFASKLGINRAIARASIPLVRI